MYFNGHEFIILLQSHIMHVFKDAFVDAVHFNHFFRLLILLVLEFHLDYEISNNLGNTTVLFIFFLINKRVYEIVK